MKLKRAALLFGVLTVAGCVPKREAPPTPAPQPRPVQTPAPRPQPPAPPPRVDWPDMPLTPGGWVYRNQGNSSQALFGPAGGEAAFIVRCDRVRREVSLWRQGTTSGNMMTVRNSASARNLPLSVQAQPTPYVWSALPASDRFLDATVFSRGRFAVEVPGTPMLVIPSWPEPARVLEDCRG
jgi:hypothetical protein